MLSLQTLFLQKILVMRHHSTPKLLQVGSNHLLHQLLMVYN